MAVAAAIGLLPMAATAAELPPEADRVLWCGSAFYWLAVDASDAGEEAESDLYLTWADTLLARATDLLAAAGFDPDAIDASVEASDTAVVAELDTPTARYDVTTCPELLAAD